MQFEVKEYGKICFPIDFSRSSVGVFFNFDFHCYDLSVLPKFSVKLTVPPYILRTDNEIKIAVTSRYER